MRYRSLKATSTPVVEPVTLAEAKAHRRVDTVNDDDYLVGLIRAAREYCEAYMDETLLPTQYVMKFDTFPPETIELPRPPMLATGTATAVTITYTTGDTGATATLATTEYRVDRDSVPGTIRPPYNQSWPTHLKDYNAISVTWWAGRQDITAVSQRVKSAMLMLVGFWYEYRGAVLTGTISKEIEFGVKALLDSVKWGSYA